MWKLPNGKVINRAKAITIGDVNYPAQIFHRWTKAELNAHGIYPYREVSYDRKFFRSTSTVEEEIDGEIVKSHTVVPRYTNQEVRNVFAKMIKTHLRSNWMFAKEEYEYLQEFEPNNTDDLAVWVQYRSDLRQAATDIKAAFQALTSYEEAIAFIKNGYVAMLPAIPFQDTEDI